jgi:hypothetical protein
MNNLSEAYQAKMDWKLGLFCQIWAYKGKIEGNYKWDSSEHTNDKEIKYFFADLKKVLGVWINQSSRDVAFKSKPNPGQGPDGLQFYEVGKPQKKRR